VSPAATTGLVTTQTDPSTSTTAQPLRSTPAPRRARSQYLTTHFGSAISPTLRP